MKVVIDTNVLLKSIPRVSSFRPIFDAILSRRLVVAVSVDILHEYLEVVERETSLEVAQNLHQLLLSKPNVLLTTVHYRWGLITADLDDNKFVDCAIAASADFVVTDDKHFSVLAAVEFPTVKVASSREFLKQVLSS